MDQKRSPKFRIGDKVKVTKEAFYSKGYCVFDDDLLAALRKTYRISKVFESDSEISYGMLEVDWVIQEKHLKLFKKTSEPKFKVGDWVILKEEIISHETALEQLPEMLRAISFNDNFLKWRKRFMKVNDIWMSESGARYYLMKETRVAFFEEWLKKVE
jgi:hypothetical protein